jgi:hypothetical protein
MYYLLQIYPTNIHYPEPRTPIVAEGLGPTTTDLTIRHSYGCSEL